MDKFGGLQNFGRKPLTSPTASTRIFRLALVAVIDAALAQGRPVRRSAQQSRTRTTQKLPVDGARLKQLLEQTGVRPNDSQRSTDATSAATADPPRTRPPQP